MIAVFYTAELDIPEEQLDKIYVNLVRRHEQVAKAYQNLESQNSELLEDLEEKEKDAVELAELVQTKTAVIADLQKSAAEAKKIIDDLKEEVRRRRQQNSNATDEPQRADTTANRVTTNHLVTIHRRYEEVLKVLKENSCSMANAFRLAGCPRSTLRDFVAVAELKIVDEREHELVICDMRSSSVKELEAACRKRLRRHLPVMANMRREDKLLPLKFDDRFYD